MSLPSLEELNLSGCEHLTWPRLHQLLRAVGSRLRRLDLSVTRLDWEAFDQLQTPDFPSLWWLNLEHCHVLSDRALAKLLAEWSEHLQVVDLTGTRLSKRKECMLKFEEVHRSIVFKY